jgi:hypothetical protein
VNTQPDGYLTTAEVGRRLKWSPRTIREKIAGGIFREGVHFFQQPSCHRLWKWSAVVAWLEGKERVVIDRAGSEQVRLARAGGRELLDGRQSSN